MKKLIWADLALGGWLLGAPLLFGYSVMRGIVLGENILPGSFLVITSILILSKRAAALVLIWSQEICGLWLVIGAFLLMFHRLSSAALDSLIVGFLILGVNLAVDWQATEERATI